MNVARKMPFNGQRQREALSTLQDASGKDATVIAQEVGLSYPQYLRYVWGKLPLRVDQLPAFASSYGVTVAKLADRLGMLDDLEDGKNAPVFRRALRGVAPEWLLDELAPDFEDANEEAQRSAAVDVAEMIRDAIRKITPDLNESLRRNRSA